MAGVVDPGASPDVDGLAFPGLASQVSDEHELTKELSQYRESFSKLKFNICELETKQGVLESIWKDKVSVTDEELQTIEDRCTSAKAAFKASKAEVARLEKDVVALCDSVARKWHTLALRRSSVADVEAMREKTAATIASGPPSERFGRVDSDTMAMDTDAKCEAVLGAQVAVIQELSSSIQQLKDEVERLSWDADTLQKQLSSMPNHPSSTEALEPDEVAVAEELASLIEFIAGIELVVMNDNEVSVKLTDERRTLLVRFDPTNLSVVAARLEPVSDDDPVSIDDIVEWCIESREDTGLTFLVNEVRERIAATRERRARINRLSEAIPSCTETLKSIIVPVPDTDLVCTLEVPCDFDGAKAVIVQFDVGPPGLTEEKAEALVDAINSDPDAPIDLVEFIRSIGTRVRFWLDQSPNASEGGEGASP
ncbi:Kinetochore protein Sos7 coiled-coil domain-containing protein [Plasmodiophora brassicae]|uniref:Kinetochore protein Sos7 coiled-coil domain-containing protein n=1 Tax=Plasmodiophora brassicae TaxID=37360 RepID=A0A3P3Y2L1_PLABS|nr:unnamed protein product [Plasmodiophora brassicae]